MQLAVERREVLKPQDSGQQDWPRPPCAELSDCPGITEELGAQGPGCSGGISGAGWSQESWKQGLAERWAGLWLGMECVWVTV